MPKCSLKTSKSDNESGTGRFNVKKKCNNPKSSHPAITSQKERYGSVDGERGGGLRLHDVCGVVGLLDDDCRDSGVGRKECHPVHKITHLQSFASSQWQPS